MASPFAKRIHLIRRRTLWILSSSFKYSFVIAVFTFRPFSFHRSAFSVHRSAFHVQRSPFSVQRSSVQRSSVRRSPLAWNGER
ncbi:MAG: hypothetical protein EHM61_16635 [Acidobacteria bacterium]|nr:MAG: hypothetical protein EHM61_16635 [Acidobacteriota bacterium]